jgi:hypothetical protein
VQFIHPRPALDGVEALEAMAITRALAGLAALNGAPAGRVYRARRRLGSVAVAGLVGGTAFGVAFAVVTAAVLQLVMWWAAR